MNNEKVNPLVSVIIPTYKRSEKLARAIKSVINQTYSNTEILVVSDNEPNDEYSVAAQNTVDSFCDNRVKLVLQQHHKNGAAARNAGIKVSSGEYIAFLDDDDFWDNEKLELQVRLLNTLDKTWGGVSCKNKVFLGGRLVALQQGYKSGYLYKRILMRQLEVSTDTILVRRDCLFDTGLYDENLLRHQEVQLLVFFTAKYKMKLLDQYLVNVDIDDNKNRPNPEKLKKIKEAFLESVKPILDDMCGFERFNIKLMNRFEVGGLYVRNGSLLKGLCVCSCVLLSPIALYSSICLVLRKVKSRRESKTYPNSVLATYVEKNNL